MLNPFVKWNKKFSSWHTKKSTKKSTETKKAKQSSRERASDERVALEITPDVWLKRV